MSRVGIHIRSTLALLLILALSILPIVMLGHLSPRSWTEQMERSIIASIPSTYRDFRMP